MSKYEPLGDYLKKENTKRVDMTFAQIEGLGIELPDYLRKHEAGWYGAADKSPTHTQKEVWHNAGYKVESVSLIGERVIFVKLGTERKKQTGRMDYFIRPTKNANPEKVKFIPWSHRLFMVYDSDGDMIGSVGHNNDTRKPSYWNMEIRFNYTYHKKHIHRDWHIMKSGGDYVTKDVIEKAIAVNGECVYNAALDEISRGASSSRIVIPEPEPTIEHIDEIKYGSFDESERNTITVEIIKRSAAARQACLDKQGYTCKICSFDFEKRYGAVGKNFIEVHHLESVTTLSLRDGYAGTDPEKDLLPVCSNCHAMLHKKRPAFTPDEIKANLR